MGGAPRPYVGRRAGEGHPYLRKVRTVDDDKGRLILKGRVLDRQNRPKFRVAYLDFGSVNFDAENATQRYPERVDITIDELTGAFRIAVYPASNGEAWVGKMTLIDYNGKPYVDYRVLPADGEVDFFAAAKATSLENVVWPEGETPVLVSDYNKPGGPLQLTDDGTIGDAQVPGDFLRVDDNRIPELRNYVTKADYLEALANNRKTVVHRFDEADVWEFDYSTVGIDYHPIVQTFETDGSELEGALSYPVGTTKVLVEWGAPTSGVLVLR